jgi:hypothetical protein
VGAGPHPATSRDAGRHPKRRTCPCVSGTISTDGPAAGRPGGSVSRVQLPPRPRSTGGRRHCPAVRPPRRGTTVTPARFSSPRGSRLISVGSPRTGPHSTRLDPTGPRGTPDTTGRSATVETTVYRAVRLDSVSESPTTRHDRDRGRRSRRHTVVLGSDVCTPRRTTARSVPPHAGPVAVSVRASNNCYGRPAGTCWYAVSR